MFKKDFYVRWRLGIKFLLVVFILIPVFVFCFSLSSPFSRISASSTIFDPTNLTSDAIFTANDAMSEQDIQNFLVAQNSVLATIPSSMLGAGANGRSAAQIIYDYTRGQFVGGVYANSSPTPGYAHYNQSNPLTISINPQVVLATLQKEQSLISISSLSGLASDGSSLNSAMGMLCPESGGCSGDAVGFNFQVMMGTAQLMIDYVGTNMPKAPNCQLAGSTIPTDGTPVYLSNMATAALYCYTPHIYNGNYNFWYDMNAWFGIPPNIFGNNVQIIKGSGVDVYAYWPDKNLRWYISNLGLLAAWGIKATTVQTVTDATLNGIPIGSGQLGTLVKGTLYPYVYYISNGFRYHIKSDSIFPQLGVTWSQLQVIDQSVIDQIPAGPPYGLLARSPIRPDLFLLTNNTKYYIPSGATLLNWGYTWNDIDIIPQQTIDPEAKGPALGWMMRQNGDPSVYLVSDSRRMYISSYNIMKNWGLNWSGVAVTGPEITDILPRGSDLTQVAKGTGPDVYYIQNGQRRYVSSFSKLSAVGLGANSLVQVSNGLLFSLPQGPNL